MLYVIYSQSYEDFEFWGVFEGSAGLSINKIHDKFFSRFDYRGLGKPKYPMYDGPMIKSSPPVGSCYSGSIEGFTAVFPDRTRQTPNMSSKEYKEWTQKCAKVSKKWDSQRKAAIKEAREKYGGKELEDIFINYLAKEYGLVRVEAEEVNL